MLIIAAFNILSVDLKRAWAKGFAAATKSEKWSAASGILRLTYFPF